MSWANKLKLYRVKTVFNYLVDSWGNSAFVVKQSPEKKRVSIYFDLVKSFLLYGADFNDYCTFSFWDKNDELKDTFITVKRNDKLRFAMSTPCVYNLLLDKAAFNERYHRWVKRGWIASTRSSVDEIVRFIDRHNSVIAKPLSDYGGHGVMKISNDEAEKADKIKTLIQRISAGEHYIVEEVITNCENLKRLAPASLNTVRIVTVIDKRGEMHVIASLLRMGNGKAVTDNYHDGGMACAIDLKTMSLKGKAKGMNCISYDVHPYSNIRFDGYLVPEVQRCMEILKEVVFTEPEARYVGWDFAITREGGGRTVGRQYTPG